MTSVDTPSSGRDPVDAAARDDLRGLFELETVHRRGAASVVCLARDLEYNQPVALKVIPRVAATRESEDAFHRAAALVAALDHPHVVPMYSAGATDRFFWCSMEFVEGRSLAEGLRSSGPMDPAACLRLVEQVAGALDAAHRLGVVHAGLTPANVLIDAAGDAHVTDFWIPWVLERLGALPGDGGKARRDKYRPPEQLSELQSSPEADQYALAALMQACLGKTPRIPGDIARALERGLNPTPGARFPSVSAFAAALGSSAPPPSRSSVPQLLVLHEDDDDAGDVPESQAYAPPASRWRWVPAGVLTLLVVGAVAAPWLLSSRSTGDQALDSAERHVPPPADSQKFAEPDRYRPDTAALTSPAPVVEAPVRAAPERRPSAARPSQPRPLPKRVDVPAVATPGRLFINATPWGQVYVDGELIGNTPRVDVPVSPGSHQLRVVRDGFQPYEVAIRVAAGQELRITDIVLQELKR